MIEVISMGGEGQVVLSELAQRRLKSKKSELQRAIKVRLLPPETDARNPIALY